MTAALLVAACGAALVLVSVSAAVVGRRKADRRRQALLAALADDVGLAARQLERALDRVAGASSPDLRAVGAPLTLADVLGRTLAAAVARSGADAAAARVEGPHGAPVNVAWGDGVDVDLLDSALAATGPGAFNAATVRWSYQPVGGAGGRFRTATVVPIVEDDRATGALVAFASSDSALGPTEERALRSIADEAAAQLAAARRFEELDRRYLTDAGTGVRNRTAYETDLERAVEGSRETARPLSVVLLEIGAHGPWLPDRENHVLADVARAVSRVSRADDVVYRPRDRQLALVLRGTDDAGAGAVAARVGEGVRPALAPSERLAIATAQWRASESAESLDDRAARALEAALRALVEDEGAEFRG